METYLCKSCNTKFDATGVKEDWIDAAFGPCSKMLANCPECNAICDEYRAPKQTSGGQSFHSHPPSCGSCCGGCGL